jgi:hypothetical protein
VGRESAEGWSPAHRRIAGGEVLLERGTLDERKAIRVVGPQGWAELERRPHFRRIGVCSLSRYSWLRSRVADSINPVTIAVAVYLSATPDPVRRLAGFAVGVFVVYLREGLCLCSDR